MEKHNQINYIEIPARDISKAKTFFSEVFQWTFVDYGSEYTSFTNDGVDGGFYKSDNIVSTESGSVLIVLYSIDLETTAKSVLKAGGTITKPIFSFPGGRRFHFTDLNGNEFAVWSE